MVKEADAELVHMIRKGGVDREKALKTIYTNSKIKEKLASMILFNNGNSQDGEDMYQEAIIVLDKNIREGNFRTEGSLESYLFSIGKFLWMNQLRKKKLTLKEKFYDHELIGEGIEPDLLMINDQRNTLLKELLGKLGKRCQEILALWQLSYSMEEIATRLGLHDSSTARKAKYDCQQQLIKIVHQNHLTKPDLS